MEEPQDWDENQKAAKAPPLAPARLKPLGQNILVKRLVHQVESSKGGILLPNQFQTSRAQVVRLGNDVPEGSQLNPGDLVDTGDWDYGYHEMTIGSDFYALLPWSRVLYKVVEE